MSFNKSTHVIAFVISLGIVAYLASALWSAVFIVSLPMDEDAITDAIEIETGKNRYGEVQTEWHPTEFKNTLEELKYYHNERMRDRNRYWVYGELIVGGLLGFFVFYIIPKWRKTQEHQHDTSGIAVGSVVLGVLVVLIVPLVLSWVLPPPIRWFPQKIVSIAETRQREVLTRLKVLAKQLDSERNQSR